MEPKSLIKVGATAIVAVIVAFGLYFYLSHLNPNTYRVRVAFSDTQGLLRQSVVRMQGVSIGEVVGIDLDTNQRPPTPVVTMAIRNEYKIPADSSFVIVSGLLITNPQVQVVANPKAAESANPGFLPTDGKTVYTGAKPLGALASLSPELATTVQNLNSSLPDLKDRLTKASDKINTLLDNANKLTVTTNQAATTAKNLITDPTIKPRLNSVLNNFRQVSFDAAATSRDLSRSLREVVASAKGPLTKLPNRLNDILTRVDATIENANTVFSRLTDQVTDPRFTQSLQQTAELAQATLARFNQIASDLHEFTGDPTLRNDLKTTVTNLKATTDQGQQVLERINGLLGKVDRATSKGTKITAPKIAILANVSERLDPGQLRVDVDARIPTGQKSLVDLGLFDIGGTTRLNLQAGNQLTPNSLVRYGLHASKLGIGGEYYFTPGTGVYGPGTGIRADLYDTNKPRLDVRGLIRVNKNASLWIGGDGIFRQVQPTVGIQYTP